MEIELPPPIRMAHVPVPLADEVPPRYYPDIVEAFESRGFRRIGGVRLDLVDPDELEELVLAHPEHVRAEFREAADVPDTLLAAPDASAFVGVGWFDRQPSVRVRSLLADGRLVETQRGWDHLPVPMAEMEPYVDRLRLRPEQDRSARGRLFTIVPGGGAAEVWDAHRRALSGAGSPAVEHGSIDQATSLWSQVQKHDEAIERNVVLAYVRFLRVSVMVTVPVILGLVLAGIYFWAAEGSISASSPWLEAASALSLVSALALFLVAKRLSWWLRYVRWIRPPFRGAEIAG